MSSTVTLDLGRNKEVPATEDQANALQKLGEFLESGAPVFVLEGYAGTGKTALVKTLLERSLKKVAVMFGAPSHQARIVLSAAIGGRANARNSFTTQSLAGVTVDNVSGNFRKTEANEKRWEGVDVVIIDEASMISESDLDKLVEMAAEHSVTLIFMGDPGQALPIRTSAADSKFSGQAPPVFTRYVKNKATLQTVMRQKSDSSLVALTAILRGLVALPDSLRRKVTELNSRGEGVVYHRREESFIREFLRVAQEARSKDPKALEGVKVISWTNKSRAKWAVRIRETLFPNSEDGFAPGMVVTGYKTHKENYRSDVFQVFNSGSYLIKRISALQKNSYGYQGRWFTLEPITTGADETQAKHPRLFIVDSSEHSRLTEEANLKLSQAIKRGIPWPIYYAFMAANLSTRPILKTAGAKQAITKVRLAAITALTEQLSRIRNTGESSTASREMEEELEELKFEEASSAGFSKVVTGGDPIFENGISITAHKAQGSTYEYAFVDEDNLDQNPNTLDAKHLKYTAVSRASKVVHLLSAQAESSQPQQPVVESPSSLDVEETSTSPARQYRQALERVKALQTKLDRAETLQVEVDSEVELELNNLKGRIANYEESKGKRVAASRSARESRRPSSRTPVSIKQGISWAAKEYSDATGRSLREVQRGFDPLRKLIATIESDEKLDIKGREDAITEAAAPYYLEHPALRGFVTRLFRDAPNREERYLENRLNGYEPGYIGEPGHRKSYQADLFESLPPKAAVEVKALLEDKPYPNMQRSHPKLSHSARYSRAAEAIFEGLPDIYGNKGAQEILKLAMRSGRAGATLSAVASQKIRRKLGARLLGHVDTGGKKQKLADRVLEALTVLIEEQNEDVWNWTEQEILKFAESHDLRLLRNAEQDLVVNSDTKEGALPFIPSKTAEKVSDVLREYMGTPQFNKHSFIEVGQDIITTMENLRKFANKSVGYEWITPFRYGQDRYMIHQYSYDESEAPEERERLQSEETGRIIDRDDDHKTYTEAALKFGHMPRTLNAAELIESWGTSVNQIMQNKILLTGLSRVRDVYGNSMVIPARGLKAQEGKVPGSVISEEDAEASLKSLVTAAEQYAAAYRKTFTWHQEPEDSIWDSLNKLIQELDNTSFLSALGYERVTVKRTFGLQNQDFYVVKGAPLQAVRHLVEENFEELAADGDKIKYKFLNALLKINRAIKAVNVGFSLFHHFALMESWLADTGALGVFKATKNVLTARKTYTEMMENSDVALKWIQHGLQVSAVPYDVGLNIIDSLIGGMGKKFDAIGLPFVGTRVRKMLNLKKGFDNFLWHKMLPVMKIQMAEAAFQGVSKTNPLVVDIPLNQMTAEQKKATYEARDDISKYINDALGSQEWSQYLWATPQVRDALNTVMFAPDWTLSALNISGAPEAIGKTMDKKWLGYESFTDFGTKRRLTHYIPGFFAWVFVAWPAAIQIAIALAYGDDDDDVQLFPFQNEKGREFSANITPLILHYQRKRGVVEAELSREKVYVQPGKQVREVIHWFQDPVRTGFSKLASPIRMAATAATGVVSPSIYADKVWAARNEKDKWSKVAASMFPFAATAMLKEKDIGGPVGALLTTTMPRKGGATRYSAQAALTGIYRDFLKGKGVRTQRPEAAFDIMERRIEEQRENFLNKAGSGNETLWRMAKSGALSKLRTQMNSQLKSEYMKPDVKRDAAKIQRLLYTVLLTHKSTKTAYMSLERSFESILKTQSGVRDLEKVSRLTGSGVLRQVKQDLYGVAMKSNVRSYKLK